MVSKNERYKRSSATEVDTKDVNNISKQISFHMKFVTVLPTMAVLAQQKFKSEPDLKPTAAKQGRISSETIQEECTSQIPNFGGFFKPTNDGRSGGIELREYPDHARCRHFIKADDNCKALRIKYDDVAVGIPAVVKDGCDGDFFWFEAEDLTPSPQCHCFGDGCFDNDISRTLNNGINTFNSDYQYYSEDEPFDVSDETYLGGSDEFVVNSNSFTFFFKSDHAWSHGHIIFNWECVEPTTTNKITNIVEMSNAVLDGSGARGFTASDSVDYGCAGRGAFNPFAKTKGRQVDAADRAFYIWKKCVQCATGNDLANIEPYDYDQANDSCGKSSNFINAFLFLTISANSSDSSHAVCECDRALVNTLYDEVPANTNFDADSCIKGKLLN